MMVVDLPDVCPTCGEPFQDIQVDDLNFAAIGFDDPVACSAEQDGDGPMVYFVHDSAHAPDTGVDDDADVVTETITARGTF